METGHGWMVNGAKNLNNTKNIEMNQKVNNRTTSGLLAIVSPFFQVLTFQCLSLL